MKRKFTLIVFVVTISSFVLAVGFAGLAGEQQFRDFALKVSEKYSNGAELQSRTVEEKFSAESLTEINVAAIGTDVRFESSPDGQVHIRYTYKKLETEKEPGQLRNEIAARDGNILKVHLDRYSSEEKNIRLNLVSLVNLGVAIEDARAVIRVPSGIRKIRVNSVSGDLKFENQRLELVGITVVSGDADFRQCEVDELEHQSVSGDLEMRGAFAEVKSRTVSGDLKLESRLAAPVIRFNTTSGDAEIRFEAVAPDMRVYFDTTSGAYRSRETTPQGWNRVRREGSFENLVLGSGKGVLSVRSVSGDVRIE